MPWIRLDTEIDDSPRFDALDGVGRAVYIWLLRRAKRGRGSLDVRSWDADFVASRTGFAWCRERVVSALAQLSAPDGLVEVADGRVWITGWAAYQVDQTAAQRQTTARKKANEIAKIVTEKKQSHGESHRVTANHGCHDDPTVQTGHTVPTETEGSARARVETDRASTSNVVRPGTRAVVDLICARWDNWPRDQVEVSVMRLRQADPAITVDQWREIIEEAWRTADPSLGTHRLHAWLARQVRIWQRDRARTALVPPAPTSPSFREFESESEPERTPEEQAATDEAREKFFAAMRGAMSGCSLPKEEE